MANEVRPPYPIFNDLDGSPLENGYIYIGTAGLNAKASPVTVYSDRELETPVTQPLRTLGGYAVVGRTPIRFYVEDDNASILVENKHGRIVYSNLHINPLVGNNAEITYTATVGLSQIGTLDLSAFEYAVFENEDRLIKNNSASWTTPDSKRTFLDSADNKWELVVSDSPYIASGKTAIENSVAGSGSTIIRASEGDQSVYVVEDSAQANPVKASYPSTDGAANLQTNPQNMAGMVDASDLFLGEADTGCFSWWSEPIAFSRYERGQKVVYIGHVDGATGDQKITRINLESGKRETKTVWTGFIADDHNAPAINETDTGKLIIACTGHGDPVTGLPETGGEYMHYGVFNTWADVTTLPDSQAFSDVCSYAQILKLAGRIYILTRVTSTAWHMILSDDHGETWIAAGDPWPQSGDSTFKGTLLIATGQFYLASRIVDRRESVDYAGGSSDVFIRIGIAHNPSNPSSPDHDIRTASINYDANANEHYLQLGANLYVIGTGSRNISLADTVYSPDAGRTTRLLDVSASTESMMLIAEADDSAGYENAEYKLLIGSPATAVDIPVEVGEALPWPTYFPGGAFVRGSTPTSTSSDRLEMFIAGNEGLTGNQQLYRVVYQGGRFYTYLAQNSQAAIGVLGRVTGVQGALAKCAMSRFTEYGPTSPEYRDFLGSFEVVGDPAPNHIRPPYWSKIGTGGRWVIHPDGRVEMWGTASGTGVTTGTIDLPVHLQMITQIAYDDNGSSGGVKMATSGTYEGYTAPVRQITWTSDVAPASFSWYVSGVLLRESGHAAFFSG